MADYYYTGDIVMFAADWAPKNFAPCNGQLLTISQNTALFSLIGTTYGGDGRTSFALPDMRGRTVFGYSPDQPEESMGTMGGAASVTLSEANLPYHTHTADTDFTLWQNASIEEGDTAQPTPGVIPARPVVDGPIADIKIYNTAEKQANVKMRPLEVAPDAAVAVTYTGGNRPVDNMQPYLTFGFYICLKGLYPERN